MPYTSSGRAPKFSWTFEVCWEDQRKNVEVTVWANNRSHPIFTHVFRQGEAQQEATAFCQTLVDETKQFILAKCKELKNTK